ncbi:MAG: helix-turn-helix transcriptional regulator [Clostridia bacterium]|nr:helix-turn-helix transcriptional regulator [Clostridia bacterium]
MKSKTKNLPTITNFLYLIRLKELRNGIKISQAKLAPKLGVAQPLIARYETGENMPPVEFLVKVADYFDVSMDGYL